MFNLIRVVRGVVVGIAIFSVACMTTFFIGYNFYFTIVFDAPDVTLQTVFVVSVCSYTIAYLVWYLYMRHKYYSTHEHFV